jgi:hypothetical protein
MPPYVMNVTSLFKYLMKSESPTDVQGSIVEEALVKLILLE